MSFQNELFEHFKTYYFPENLIYVHSNWIASFVKF